MTPKDLARGSLSRPDLFPPEFVSWVTRLIDNNPRVNPAIKSSGGSTSHGITANWSGVLLTVPGNGSTLRVPELSGASHTWTLTKVYARCETAGSGSTTIVVETMTPDANGSWSTTTTVATLTINSGDFETSATISVSVTTGDLLRIRFTSIGTAGLFTVEATGT